MVNNSLVKRQSGTIKSADYESNGVQIHLDVQTVKNYLVSGNKGAVTDQDIVLFMELCRANRLNPFIREAYLVKYGNNPATIVTGKTVFQKRAFRNPDFNGYKAGIIVWNESEKKSEEREGTIVLPGEQLVGGWARVFLKSMDNPFYVSIPLRERIQYNSEGKPNSVWAKQPGSMIRKCALSEALKDAFPEDLGNLYSPEEVAEMDEVKLDENVVEVVDEVKEVVEEKAESLEDMFGA